MDSRLEELRSLAMMRSPNLARRLADEIDLQLQELKTLRLAKKGMYLNDRENYLIRILLKEEIKRNDKEINYKERVNDNYRLEELKEYNNRLKYIYNKFWEESRK